MRAAFVPDAPGMLPHLSAVSKRRDLPKGPRQVWPVRQFRSIETAMRHRRRIERDALRESA